MKNEPNFWSRISTKYAASPINDEAAYTRTLEITKTFKKPTNDVLEIGCGTGSTALLLAPGVARFTGTDFSQGMIDIAARKLDGSQPNLTFKTASALLQDGPSIDAVLAFNLLHLVSDLDAALASIAKRIKPGGLFISKTVCRPDGMTLKYFGISMVIPVMQLFGKAPYVQFLPIQILERKITSLGFDLIERLNAPDGALPSRYIGARKL